MSLETQLHFREVNMVNPLLQKERSKTTVSAKALGNFIHGGPSSLARILELHKVMQSDPVFDTTDRPFLSHTDRYLRSAEKMAHFHKLVQDMKLTEQEIKYAYAAIDEVLPTDVHMAMVIPALEGQASKEQKDRWLPYAKSFKILGAYVQTELGHGSNVRALETTATFDLKSAEWVIHSPTLTSTKWWPGGLGKTATHCILMARVIIKDRDYGVSPFFIQIRDLGDHKPLSGIVIGDIGPKLGFNSTDNGFMRFTHHRVPLDRMLMGVAEVSADGTYTRIPGGEKAAYGAMLDVRANLVMKASSSLARAVTIAVRFSSVRLQGFSAGSTTEERPVLEYPSQQRPLMPLLAYAYALHFTGGRMREEYESFLSSRDASILPALHATSSGLKALITQSVADGIETARKLCGGHGYSHASGLPDASANYLALATLEGTQQVLEPQLARHLLRCLSIAQRGGRVPADVAYLGGETELLCSKDSPCPPLHPLCYKAQIHLFERRALIATLALAEGMAAVIAQGGCSESEALIKTAVSAGKASIAHCQLHILRCFSAGVGEIEDAVVLSATASGKKRAVNGSEAVLGEREARVLRDMCSLYALSTIEEYLGDFREDDTITSSQARDIRLAVESLCSRVRDEAVALTDAFHFTDAILCSCLGRYDGDMYPALMKWVMKEPLNSTEVAKSLPYIKDLVGVRPGARI